MAVKLNRADCKRAAVQTLLSDFMLVNFDWQETNGKQPIASIKLCYPITGNLKLATIIHVERKHAF